jgi:hypothetical protein
MVREVQYTNIKRVLDNLLDHPLLRDLTLEQAVRHTIRFISLHGYPRLYQDKIDIVDINEFRGTLPCDLISIIQVKDMRSGLCLRAMTDNFTHGMEPHPKYQKPKHVDAINNVRHRKSLYIPHRREITSELAFKTQGRIIYTSFPHGKVEIAYKAIPVDEDNFPLIIDNETYLTALEAYIKKQVFTVKFDTGKITAGVLQNAQADYAWAAGALQDEFTVPSVSEMESITRMWNTLIPKVREFDNGFIGLGNREHLVLHNGGESTGGRYSSKTMPDHPTIGEEVPPLGAVTRGDIDAITNLPSE